MRLKTFPEFNLAYTAPVLVTLVLIAILIALPTGFEDKEIYRESELSSATVISADDSSLVDTGLVRSGEQRCVVEIRDGAFAGTQAYAINMLNGSLEADKLFVPGDTALVRINADATGDKILSVSMIDHYRITDEFILAGLFFLLLVLFAGKTGLRAILSFGLTILLIWKVLVPLYLKGYQPVWIGLGIAAVLTVLIIALVYGFDRRCLAATAGALLGILVTCVLGVLFTDLYNIHGAVMASSESLLYAGYSHLNLTQIFMASIFIASSGAMMDLSVDITSAIQEVVEKRPDIRAREAIRSGLNVGRAAMGTMTTTLLLAYSGGYIALLMVFTAQGTPIATIFNYKFVAAELIHTIVGSFGLVTVAPLTALCAGVLLTRKPARRPIEGTDTPAGSDDPVDAMNNGNQTLRFPQFPATETVVTRGSFVPKRGLLGDADTTNDNFHR